MDERPEVPEVPQRLTFNRFIDWAFLSIISLLVWYGIGEIGRLNENIKMLNEKMAVAIERLSVQDHQIEAQNKRMDTLESRIRDLEVSSWKHHGR